MISEIHETPTLANCQLTGQSSVAAKREVEALSIGVNMNVPTFQKHNWSTVNFKD